jgi:DNA-binding MarR family transcriptional regulator
MPSNAGSVLDQQLCFAVYSTSLAMTQAYKPLLASLGMTYPQYLVLLALWEQDGIKLSELARQLRQDPGSLSPVLKRMQACGWLVRERVPGDERSVALILTPEGKALKAKAKRVQQAFGKACALQDKEIGDLHGRLSQLRDRLLAP